MEGWRILPDHYDYLDETETSSYFSVKLNFHSDFQDLGGEWTCEIQILLCKQTWKHVSVTDDFGDLFLLGRIVNFLLLFKAIDCEAIRNKFLYI